MGGRWKPFDEDAAGPAVEYVPYTDGGLEIDECWSGGEWAKTESSGDAADE